MTENDIHFEYRTDDKLIYSLSPEAILELTRDYGIDELLYVCGIIVKDNGEIFLEKYCDQKEFLDYGRLGYNDDLRRDLILNVSRIERK